uniref:Uncharacterized protein n=1 Tax=Anguilla anguilla TaxID=7936 RepID=A0A0E9SSI7_ANGAN
MRSINLDWICISGNHLTCHEIAKFVFFFYWCRLLRNYVFARWIFKHINVEK